MILQKFLLFSLADLARSVLIVNSSPIVSPVTLSVDFQSFLARADPIWSWNVSSPSGMPTEWTQSLFVGNGNLGGMLWANSLTELRLNTHAQTLWDDRTPDMGLPKYLNNFVFDQPRLPSGYWKITWNSGQSPMSITGRVSIYDAVASLNITTTNGSCILSFWASAAYDISSGGADVLVIETLSTDSEGCILEFIPEIAQSTWSGQDSRYIPNPPPINSTSVISPESVLTLVSQPHLKGTFHTSGFLKTQLEPTSATYIFTISPVVSSQSLSDDWVKNQVITAQGLLPDLKTSHETVWHNWWPAGGFVTFEFSVLEAFWFIQLYKFKSGSRRGIVHDLEGPWFIEGTDWPDLHWDLNLQYPYYLPITAYRPDISQSLTDYVEFLMRSGNLKSNVPSEWQFDSAAAPTGASSLSGNETCYWNYGADCKTAPPSITGNLLWTLEVVHMSSTYHGNETIDKEIVFPLLDQALQFYQHFQIVNETDGSIHLPVTFSPEWPGGPGPDANYDISLYRWGLALAIDLAQQYNLSSPHLEAWKNTLNNIISFSIDPVTDTFEVYAGVPYNQPHRHFSHLFMIFPLRLIDVSNSSQYQTARNSVNLWLATPEMDSQFYRPAASAMNILLSQRAAAFDNITFLLNTRIEGSTWYREGSQGSCTETPYAAAWAVTDWFVQSWNLTLAAGPIPVHIIHLYPGIDSVIRLDQTPYEAAPAKVASASFYRLAVEGGVLVSAARQVLMQNLSHYITRTSFVAVERLDNVTVKSPLVLRTDLERPLSTFPLGVTITELGDGNLIQVDLAPGEGCAIFSTAFPPDEFAISPANGCAKDFNHFGVLNEGGGVGGSPVKLSQCVLMSDGLVSPTQRFEWNASTGQFALQDGSGRCLSVESCSVNDGTTVTLAPCALPSPSPPSPDSIGCSTSSTQSCLTQSQTWFITSSAGFPPNAIITNTTSHHCIDVNGATNPNDIDVWTCGSPGAYKNDEFIFNSTISAIQSLDSDPQCNCQMWCLTPTS
jgi:alpha-L-fucosidase 2